MNNTDVKRARELSRAIAGLGIGTIKVPKKVLPKKAFSFPYEALKKELPDNRDVLLRQATQAAQEAAKSAAELTDTVAKLHQRAVNAENAARISADMSLSHAKIIDTLTKKLEEKAPEQPQEIIKETIIQKEAEAFELTDEMVREIVQKMQKLPEQHKLEVQGIRNFQSFVYKGTKYGMEEMMHGAGDTVVAGTNVTITNTASGKQINASGGVGAWKTPAETPDSSRTTFTVTAQPTDVVADGINMYDGAGYTYATLVITFTNAPSQYVRYR